MGNRGRRKRPALMLAVTVLAAAVVIPATAGAAPPETSERSDWTFVYDFENNLLVYWNVTREALCEWTNAGEERPLVPEGVTPIPFREVHADNDYVRVSYSATRHIELWQLAGNEPGDGCEPTVGDVPWAVGTARVSLAVLIEEGVSDLRHKLDGQGNVTNTATGQDWHFSFTSLWFPDRGEFRPVQEFNLSQLGR